MGRRRRLVRGPTKWFGTQCGTNGFEVVLAAGHNACRDWRLGRRRDGDDAVQWISGGTHSRRLAAAFQTPSSQLSTAAFSSCCSACPRHSAPSRFGHAVPLRCHLRQRACVCQSLFDRQGQSSDHAVKVWDCLSVCLSAGQHLERVGGD